MLIIHYIKKIIAIVFAYAIGQEPFKPSDIAFFLMENTAPGANVLIHGFDAFSYIQSYRYPKTRHYVQNITSQWLYEDIVADYNKDKYDCVVVAGNRYEKLQGDNYSSQFCRLLEKQYQDEKYSRLIEQDSFYAYLR